MPAHNCASSIEKVVRDNYEKVISELPGSEFIVAEDGSTDGTKEILARLEKELPIKLVVGKERKGYLRALKDAFKLPDTEYVFISDSDGEHDPDDFWSLYEKALDNDVVVGYKVDRKPYYRYLVSQVNNFLLGLLFGLWLSDANCGFRIVRKSVIDEIIEDVGAFRWSPMAEFCVRAKKKGYRIAQVPVRHIETESIVFSAGLMPKVILEQLADMVKLKMRYLTGKG